MKTLMVFCLMVCGSVSYGNEWVPYREYRPVAPVAVQLPVIQQYPVVTVPVVVPLVVPYVPVVTYDSILVEHKQWCLFKRYEIVNVPRVSYIPVRY